MGPTLHLLVSETNNSWVSHQIKFLLDVYRLKRIFFKDSNVKHQTQLKYFVCKELWQRGPSGNWLFEINYFSAQLHNVYFFKAQNDIQIEVPYE